MKRVVAGILIAATVASAHAEPMYVSDKLVVNVYEAADQESTKITTLDSGDAVELIEKLDTFSHVRLADSREGWIKSSYWCWTVFSISLPYKGRCCDVWCPVSPR